jgi:radical SAM enzyme (TIGR01210 family)
MDRIKKFLTERGVTAPPPDRPVETYAKYWERTVRWLAAAAQASDIVKDHGQAAALDILNQAIGQPAFFTDRRYLPQLKRQAEYGFILLPGGCEWALKKDQGGQCTFCEFQEVVDFLAGDLPFSHEEFLAIFQAGYAGMADADILNVFTAGSFLNPGEMPLGSQAAMATLVAASLKTSVLRVESRVQYIVDETVAPLTAILAPAGKTLDIAIGFETKDDDLRNKALRKGMGRRQFEHAVAIAKQNGARVSAYVILMPVALDEGYAIQECIDSIRYAFEAGCDEVLLQARYSHYPDAKCPWLWSILKVLNETASLGPVMLGRWETELPEPKVWPKNCDACTPEVMKAIVGWRDALDPSTIAEAVLPTCGCRAEWEKEAAKTDPPPRRVTLPTAP